MAKRKKLTWDQAKRAKKKAVAFVQRVLKDPVHAASIAAKDLGEWVERTDRTVLENPPQRRRNTNVANGTTPTKADMRDAIDEACGILAQAYDPMTTREDAIQAIADALDALEGDDADDDVVVVDEDEADDSDDDEDDDGDNGD